MAALHFDKLKLVLSSDFFCDEFWPFSEKYLDKIMLSHKFPVFEKKNHQEIFKRIFKSQKLSQLPTTWKGA
jgi:hypothetical protein